MPLYPLIGQHAFSDQAWLAHLHHGLRLELASPITNVIAQLNQHLERPQHPLQPLSQIEHPVLTTGNHLPLRFTNKENLPPHLAYEAYIYQTGLVPTRNNWHDFFNAWVWLTFPRLKAVFNHLQANEILEHGVQHQRGAARDTLTLFDENASILVSSNRALLEDLQQFNWHSALADRRGLWANVCGEKSLTCQHDQAQLFPVGHALFEKLLVPRKNICTHALLLEVPQSFFGLTLRNKLIWLDANAAQLLPTLTLHPHLFQPLPILGVPHFWADNMYPSFYNDDAVFRSARKKQSGRLPQRPHF